MAISKTTFQGDTRPNQYTELLTWLQDNASTYFDSITGNGSNIVCKIGDLECLTFCMTAVTNLIEIKPKHATGYGQSTDIINAKTDTIFNYGVVTSQGIMLDWIYTSTTYRCGLFISRNTDNKVCGVRMNVEMNRGTGTDNTACLFTYDFESDPLTTEDARNAGWTFGHYPIYANTAMSSPYVPYGTYRAPCTTLSPLPLPSGKYCENILTEKLSEHWKESGKLTLNEYDYYTNGWICLAD